MSKETLLLDTICLWINTNAMFYYYSSCDEEISEDEKEEEEVDVYSDNFEEVNPI